MNHDLSFQPGNLRRRIGEVSEHALRVGKLQSIETSEVILQEGGIDFPVRMAGNLNRKFAETKARSIPTNPFLPPDPDLAVTQVSDSHLAVLNKYNVVPEHLLIVTREFESQTSEITRRDFEAWCRCLSEFPSLGFYNSGHIAGASQPHKHFQQVPLPLSQAVPELPIERLIETSQVPFRHGLHRFETNETGNWAEQVFSAYRDLLDNLSIEIRTDGEIAHPYNLLLTRGWMLLVPRTWESLEGISINGLGIAGSFFVRAPLPDSGPDQPSDIDILRSYGPLNFLRTLESP